MLGQTSQWHRKPSSLADHPALNPSSGRIVELHCSIHKQLGELMPNKNSQDVLVAAEALHGESNEILFLEHLLEDLTNNGVAGDAFRDAMDLVGIVTSSPLEQFTILPLIPMKVGNLYFSCTNPSLFMLLTLSLVLLSLHFGTENGGGNSVPNAWQSLGLGADEAFLLSSRSALAPDLEFAVLGLRPGFFLESLPFRYFRPLPLAWSRLPLAKYFQSSTSRLTTYVAPKSWTFWRRLEPLHEIKEQVLFHHTKNV
ncbi:hypothetical protein M9H77_00314 [Catharanthus roseus]|nr:hypothetical protein M9H77_00314 [Catharanthus roseus]